MKKFDDNTELADEPVPKRLEAEPELDPDPEPAEVNDEDEDEEDEDEEDCEVVEIALLSWLNDSPNASTHLESKIVVGERLTVLIGPSKA